MKREAEAAKSWFGGKKEEAKRDSTSEDLGAAFQDASYKMRDQASRGVNSVRDRCASPR